MHSSHPIHRALVTFSNSTTGEIRVKIPALLGADSEVAISYIGRKAPWAVPTVGDQIVVTSDDANLTNVFWVQTDNAYATTVAYATSATTSASSTYTNAENIKATPTAYGTVYGQTNPFLPFLYTGAVSGYTATWSEGGGFGTVTYNAPLTTVFPDAVSEDFAVGRNFTINGPYPGFYGGGLLTSSTTNSITISLSYSSGAPYSGTADNSTLYVLALGVGNISLGKEALSNWTSATSGDGQHIAIGINAHSKTIGGANNIAIGTEAMYSPYAAAKQLTRCTAIGYYAGNSFVTSSSNKMAINHSGVNMTNGEAVIGNGDGTLSLHLRPYGVVSTPNQSYANYQIGSNLSYNNSAQNVTVPFNYLITNTNSTFSTSTGRLTAAYSGTYLVNCGLYASTDVVQLWGVINGVRDRTFQLGPGVNLAGTGIFKLTAGDTFGVAGWFSGGSTTIFVSNEHTYLKIRYLG
jgi:phage baseplate assembly protein gpV